MDLTPYHDQLRTIARTDPDPRVRHRADGLLMLASGMTQADVARRLSCAPNSLRAWSRRLLAEGRDGLADRARSGRPRKVTAEARVLLATALADSPLDYDYPVTMWTVADLTDLLGQRGWTVHPITVYRVLRALGYRYRRPKLDLTHRQDPEAVASAKHVLAELQKRGLVPGLDSDLSTWMSVKSTPIPTWQRSGSESGPP